MFTSKNIIFLRKTKVAKDTTENQNSTSKYSYKQVTDENEK